MAPQISRPYHNLMALLSLFSYTTEMSRGSVPERQRQSRSQKSKDQKQRKKFGHFQKEKKKKLKCPQQDLNLGCLTNLRPVITATLREIYCKIWPKIIDKRKGWKQVLLLLLPRAGSGYKRLHLGVVRTKSSTFVTSLRQ